MKETESNAFWAVVREYLLEPKLRDLYDKGYGSLAIQGELVGPTIQNNHEQVSENQFYCFKVWNIDEQRYLTPVERDKVCVEADIKTVPILDRTSIISDKFKALEDILTYAEGPGMNKNVKREGVVFKHLNSEFSFKAISNSYLLKEKD